MGEGYTVALLKENAPSQVKKNITNECNSKCVGTNTWKKVYIKKCTKICN